MILIENLLKIIGCMALFFGGIVSLCCIILEFIFIKHVKNNRDFTHGMN